MGHKNSKHKQDSSSQTEQNFINEQEELNAATSSNSENPEENSVDNPEIQEVKNECEDMEKKVAELEQQVEDQKKNYLFLMADFDNFRKRTIKEKSEIIKNAGENVLKGLLPIVDDFERGIKAAEANPDGDSVKEGINLIYNKLKNYLSQNGVKEMDPADDIFDTEKHEAISVVPVPDEDKKGKILDTVEKGYTINDKVLRHAKVVVGQ